MNEKKNKVGLTVYEHPHINDIIEYFREVSLPEHDNEKFILQLEKVIELAKREPVKLNYAFIFGLKGEETIVVYDTEVKKIVQIRGGFSLSECLTSAIDSFYNQPYHEMFNGEPFMFGFYKDSDCLAQFGKCKLQMCE